MTALEEIKRALEGVTSAFNRVLSEAPADADHFSIGLDCQGLAIRIDLADMRTVTELLSTLESLQRENERLERERAKQWRRARRTDASRDTYSALAKTFEAEANQMRDVATSNRHRAEAAEAEVKRITESRDGYVKQRDQLQKLYDDERASCIREAKLATDMAADCNDAQARAETAESCLTQLRKAVGELLDQAEHVCLGAQTPADIKEAARNLATPIKNVHTILASTGGEHNAE